MTVSLEPPKPNDYLTVASWIADAAECKRWAGPGIRFPFSGEELPALLDGTAPIVAGEIRKSFVLVESCALGPQPRTIGFAQIVREDPAHFRLARIVVAPHRRGVGMGKLLCEMLLAEIATVPSARSVRLFVQGDNVAALRIYDKLGFTVAPPHPWPDVLSMKRTVPR